MPIDLSQYEDAALDRFRRETEAEIRRMLDAIRERLREGGKSKLTIGIVDDLIEVLHEAFGNIADKYRQELGGLLQAAGVELGSLGIDEGLTTASEGTLRAQIGHGIDDMETVRNDASGKLREAVLRALRTDQSIADLEAQIASDMEALPFRVGTLVDTTMMGVDRLVFVQQATDGGFEWFLFDGPEDHLTRPWCAPRVGRVFHASELDEEENDSGPNPPSVYGGGWNCRHRWNPLEESDIRTYPRWKGRSYDRPGGAAPPRG